MKLGDINGSLTPEDEYTLVFLYLNNKGEDSFMFMQLGDTCFTTQYTTRVTDIIH